MSERVSKTKMHAKRDELISTYTASFWAAVRIIMVRYKSVAAMTVCLGGCIE